MAQRKVNCEVYTDRGIVGKNGVDGKSAYQQAVEGGYQGTEEEFEQALASDIATVANNVTNINVVGNNIENVNTAVDNMSAIIAAPTSATQAAASASQAATSATNAQTSETNSATSASNAAESATNASASAAIATTKASEATSSATSASASANSANASATSASISAANAEIWAEGTDAQVTTLGGEHSSKVWANVSKQYAESIGAATADTLGLVKPDGNTIIVTEDGTISATGGSGSGSGFDFEGTKAEFNAAVAAGTITEDSVSLITDDVSGDNVATKAELQDRVSKAGDTMSGQLVMENGSNGIRFNGDTADNYYFVRKNIFGALEIYGNNMKGLFLQSSEDHVPCYWSGTNAYRLLTTADKEMSVGWGMPDYSAGVSVANSTILSGFTAPSDGVLIFDAGISNATINGIAIAAGYYYTPDGASYGQPVSMLLSKGDILKAANIYSTTDHSVFYPLKGVN